MYAFSALANWNDVELACDLPATSHPGVKLTLCVAKYFHVSSVKFVLALVMYLNNLFP